MAPKKTKHQTLGQIPFAKLLAELQAIYGVRVFDVDKKARKCRIGMLLPNEQTELTAIVDVLQDDSHVESSTVPEITPPSYLKVADVFSRYELQFSYIK